MLIKIVSFLVSLGFCFLVQLFMKKKILPKLNTKAPQSALAVFFSVEILKIFLSAAFLVGCYCFFHLNFLFLVLGYVVAIFMNLSLC